MDGGGHRAVLAWVELTRLGARARPAIELALRDAEACGDAGWRDMLLGLLEQLPSGSAPWFARALRGWG